jgi:Spy/CpxP family protein refolding chaperone
MKAKSLFLTLLLIAASADLAAAQATIEVKPGVQTANLADEQDDNEIVRQVFSPITEELNLTAGQRFRIANIATAAMLQADPLFQQLDALDHQLSQAAFAGHLDESQIQELAEKQTALLTQIISMKVRAKMSFYRILTDEQRAIVADQFRLRSTDGSLGSISN